MLSPRKCLDAIIIVFVFCVPLITCTLAEPLYLINTAENPDVRSGKWHIGLSCWLSSGSGEWQIDGVQGNGMTFRSHLAWDSIDSTVIALDGGIVLLDRLILRGMYGLGSIAGGQNTDSDWYLAADGSLPAQKFSESVSSTDGSTELLDIELSWTWMPANWRRVVTSEIFAGIFTYADDLTDSDGIQTIWLGESVYDPFPGRNAAYTFRWQAQKAGARIAFSPIPAATLQISVSLLFNARQEGEGTWYLRSDLLDSSPNLTSVATGTGTDASLSASYNVSRHVALNMGWRSLSFSADNGTHSTYAANGGVATTSLTMIESSRDGFFVGLSGRF